MAAFEHKPVDFSKLASEIEGLSDKQIQAHLGLYNGYVKKLNEIETKLTSADPSAANYSFNEFSELKRREAVAFNGAYLHQLYFENLRKNVQIPAKLKAAIEKDFGSFTNWETQTKGAALSTPGWVLLTYNKVDKKLHNYILFEHHIGLPAKNEIILALDCWEHAYMIDYGTAKADYLKTFMLNINWEVAAKRLEAASK
ncbi:Superoxide dismutase [Fe] [Candidatus Gugararchaeum adminiculabundum]|nr:Superoxide dismutase [Fe] [Candidatus Gugararchaeum adminiculabundum]